jgi:hypothetical protein
MKYLTGTTWFQIESSFFVVSLHDDYEDQVILAFAQSSEKCYEIHPSRYCSSHSVAPPLLVELSVKICNFQVQIYYHSICLEANGVLH